MIWKDQDGDPLEIKEVYCFDEPMLLVRTTQEGEETQVNINEGQAKEIIEFLQVFLRGFKEDLS